jgi:hypothetical protein
MELGLRSPVVGWSPVTLIRCLRRGSARFLALGASPRHVESLSRVRRGWEGLSWPVYGGGCSDGRWHAVCKANSGEPVFRWGRECAGEYGRSLGLLYRRERAGSGAGRALARSGRVEHVEVFFYPCSKACWDRKRANLGKNPAQTSSWHLWLSLVCMFQGEISPRSEDLRTPNLACLTVHLTTKVVPNHVKRIWLGFKLFQWVP